MISLEHSNRLLQRRMVMRWRETPPSEYRRVEYIQSDGAQWIDTGYVPAAGMVWTLDAAFLVPMYNNRVMVNGRFGGTNQDARFDIGSVKNATNSTFSLSIGVTDENTDKDYDSGRHIFRLDTVKRCKAIDSNEWSATFTNSVFAPNVNKRYKSLHIFMRNDSGSYKFPCVMRLWEHRITEYGIAIQRLVPVVRLADSKAGMYDLCGTICTLTNSPFYINFGTGTDFTWNEFSLQT